jgi:hypothetical protein
MGRAVVNSNLLKGLIGRDGGEQHRTRPSLRRNT